ncbi:MAG: hypothetical protein WDW36_009894 [Sanguina aurantia]
MTRDADIIKTAGLDALMVLRMHSMGLQLFLPWSVLGCAVLLPLYYVVGADLTVENLHGGGQTLARSTLMKFTISNLDQGSALLWVPFFIVTLFTWHACWVLLLHCKSYVELRRAYLLSHDFASPSVDDVLHRAATVDLDALRRQFRDMGMASRLFDTMEALVNPLKMLALDRKAVADTREHVARSGLSLPAMHCDEASKQYARTCTLLRRENAWAPEVNIVEALGGGPAARGGDATACFRYWAPGEEQQRVVSSTRESEHSGRQPLYVGKVNKRLLQVLPTTDDAGNRTVVNISQYAVLLRDVQWRDAAAEPAAVSVNNSQLVARAAAHSQRPDSDLNDPFGDAATSEDPTAHLPVETLGVARLARALHADGGLQGAPGAGVEGDGAGVAGLVAGQGGQGQDSGDVGSDDEDGRRAVGGGGRRIRDARSSLAGSAEGQGYGGGGMAYAGGRNSAGQSNVVELQAMNRNRGTGCVLTAAHTSSPTSAPQAPAPIPSPNQPRHNSASHPPQACAQPEALVCLAPSSDDPSGLPASPTPHPNAGPTPKGTGTHPAASGAPPGSVPARSHSSRLSDTSFEASPPVARDQGASRHPSAPSPPLVHPDAAALTTPNHSRGRPTPHSPISLQGASSLPLPPPSGTADPDPHPHLHTSHTLGSLLGLPEVGPDPWSLPAASGAHSSSTTGSSPHPHARTHAKPPHTSSPQQQQQQQQQQQLQLSPQEQHSHTSQHQQRQEHHHHEGGAYAELSAPSLITSHPSQVAQLRQQQQQQQQRMAWPRSTDPVSGAPSTAARSPAHIQISERPSDDESQRQLLGLFEGEAVGQVGVPVTDPLGSLGVASADRHVKFDLCSQDEKAQHLLILLHKLFPGEVDHVIPVYRHEEVDRLLREWDLAVKQLGSCLAGYHAECNRYDVPLLSKTSYPLNSSQETSSTHHSDASHHSPYKALATAVADPCEHQQQPAGPGSSSSGDRSVGHGHARNHGPPPSEEQEPCHSNGLSRNQSRDGTGGPPESGNHGRNRTRDPQVHGSYSRSVWVGPSGSAPHANGSSSSSREGGTGVADSGSSMDEDSDTVALLSPRSMRHRHRLASACSDPDPNLTPTHPRSQPSDPKAHPTHHHHQHQHPPSGSHPDTPPHPDVPVHSTPNGVVVRATHTSPFHHTNMASFETDVPAQSGRPASAGPHAMDALSRRSELQTHGSSSSSHASFTQLGLLSQDQRRELTSRDDSHLRQRGQRRKDPQDGMQLLLGPEGSARERLWHSWQEAQLARVSVRQLQEEVLSARARALASPVGVCYFVLFSSQRAATTLCRDGALPPSGTWTKPPPLTFTVHHAPPPDDIYWPALWSSRRERLLRTFATAVPLILLMLLPIGFFASILSSLPIAACAGASGTNPFYFPWFCDAAHTKGTFLSLRSLLTSVVPTFSSLLFDSVVMPLVLYLLVAAERRVFSLSGQDRRVMQFHFIWALVNQLGGAVLGGILTQIGFALTDLGNPGASRRQPPATSRQPPAASRQPPAAPRLQSIAGGHAAPPLPVLCAVAVGSAGCDALYMHHACTPCELISKAIGAALPTASNYFIYYTITTSMYSNLVRLIWPHGSLLPVLLRVIGLAQPRCARDEALIHQPPSHRLARTVSSILLHMLIGTCFSVMSPLILPISLLFFFTGWMVQRYVVLYVYERSYESGGIIFPFIFDRMLACLHVMIWLTGSVLLTNEAYWQAVLLWLLVTPALYQFRRHCVARFALRPAEDTLDLVAADAAPKAHVAAAVFLPPALRPGSCGWYPESGKVWEKFGLPKYVWPF